MEYILVIFIVFLLIVVIAYNGSSDEFTSSSREIDLISKYANGESLTEEEMEDLRKIVEKDYEI